MPVMAISRTAVYVGEAHLCLRLPAARVIAASAGAAVCPTRADYASWPCTLCVAQRCNRSRPKQRPECNENPDARLEHFGFLDDNRAFEAAIPRQGSVPTLRGVTTDKFPVLGVWVMECWCHVSDVETP